MVKVMVVLPWLGLIMTVEAVNWLEIIFHLLSWAENFYFASYYPSADDRNSEFSVNVLLFLILKIVVKCTLILEKNHLNFQTQRFLFKMPP